MPTVRATDVTVQRFDGISSCTDIAHVLLALIERFLRVVEDLLEDTLPRRLARRHHVPAGFGGSVPAFFGAPASFVAAGLAACAMLTTPPIVKRAMKNVIQGCCVTNPPLAMTGYLFLCWSFEESDSGSNLAGHVGDPNDADDDSTPFEVRRRVLRLALVGIIDWRNVRARS